MSYRRGFCWLLGLVSFPGSLLAESVVVFNEVMYHPATNEPTLEWVELHNQNAVDVDLTGWRLADGIDYTFPSGSIIRGRGYLVVAISPETLSAQASITNLLGPFTGRLSNSGEEIDLRDLNGRRMDSFRYGVDGVWPVGPDGAGVSLAKKQPNLASEPSENWTSSAQVGGTPGTTNFPASGVPQFLGPRTVVLPMTASWRYYDLGTEPAAGWRASAYDDSSWSSGAGLFYVEDAALPAPKNTPLAPDRNAYYFRGAFQLPGDPASQIVTLQPLVDDGAIFYVNGTELARLNMPTGAVSYATMAAAAVGNAGVSAPISIPAALLRTGQNDLAVELHQTSATTNIGLRVLPAAGFTVAWDGSDGDFSTTASPAVAPTNAAMAAYGVQAFSSTNPSQAANANDGRYGNSSSWTPASGDTSPFLALRFNRAMPVTSIAWSRDNGDASEVACGGTCTDRVIGNYSIQYTLQEDPTAVPGNSSNPSNGWTTIATVQYMSVQPGFSPYLRHRFELSSAGASLLATGIRLRPPTLSAIDEIEINPVYSAAFDAAFGVEVAAREILPPPPRLLFNEIAAAGTTNFWVELINAGTAPISLTGVQIVRSTGTSPSYTLPAQTLPPGGLFTLSQAQLGFNAADQNKLFLYTAGRQAFLDAVTVRTNARARYPDGADDWMVPSSATPGLTNTVVLNRDIVINEIMYHAPPSDPLPGAISNSTLVPITGSWRFNDAGVDLGSAWRAPTFDDGSWSTGAGLLSVNTGALPAPMNTVLAPDRVTYYFRARFNLETAGLSNVTLNLRAVVDDGAVFYLNGVEIYRHNMSNGAIAYSTPAAVPVGEAGWTGPLLLPSNQLVAGVNVLAVEVHQATTASLSSGIALNGGGLSLVEEGPSGGIPPANLAREAGAVPFVIDSLAGFSIHNYVGLTDGTYGNGNSWIGNSGNPGYAAVRLARLSTISSVAFGRDNLGMFTDRTFGLYTLQYTRVATPGPGTGFTSNPDTGWATIGTLNYQGPGTGLFVTPSRRHRFTFTPVDATGVRLLVPATGLASGTCVDELEVNPPDTSGDVAFGAELVLTTTLRPSVPYQESEEEWVELHNRGTNRVDLTGWRLDAGIDFRFTNGPSLDPGAFLVVARDAGSLRTKWPEVAARIVGDFSGRLGGQERFLLRDALGNPVNETRVFEGGWSDGGGSTLELRDPWADNSKRDAWADSDETAKGHWQTVTYRMEARQSYGPVRWREFRLGLLDEGVVLVDALSVIRDPDGAHQELIQNGNFEGTTGNTHWRFLGHHRGEFVTDPDNAANHVLKISAGGRALMNHNHVETTFVNNTALVDGQTYEVSYRARWLAGSPQLSTRAYFAKLARVTALEVPTRLGTPGAPNSRAVPNSGPTFSGLRHLPIVPDANQAVTISVLADDPQGVAQATLFYRVNPATVFLSLPMTLQSDGRWTASLPGQTAGKIVQFYVQAQDNQGATALAPVRGPESRALYQVADAQRTSLPAHELRLIMLDVDRDFMLNPTNVMSNARLGGTVIYDRSEVFYDAGPRLQGTAASRIRDGDSYVSYDIGFPPDHLFRGVRDNIGIDRSGRAPTARAQDEIYVQHMFRRAGLPGQYTDLCYFIAPRLVHTGTAIMLLSAFDGSFVDEQYGQDGSVFNMDITYEPDTTIDGGAESIKLAVPIQGHIGTDFADLGNDAEQYRSPFDIRVGNRRDDYSGLIRLCQTASLPQVLFDARIGAVLDVEESLRITALYLLCGIQDNYLNAAPALPHNLRLVTFADGSPAQLLAWDMDFVFGAGTSSPIFPYSGINLAKLVNNPHNRRSYLRHVYDLCQTVFNTDYMSRWLTHYGSVVGQNYSAAATYITGRRAYALTQLPAAVPFAITINNGNDFLTNVPVATITGRGWLDVREIRLAGTETALPVTWSTSTNWQAAVPLVLGTNYLAFVALGNGSNVVGSDSITVTTTASTGGADSDGDGLPDAWETAHGLNAAFDDAAFDQDGDGLSNAQEYVTGTDPNNAQSFLRIEAAPSGATTRITFLAQPGRSYSLLWREQAVAGNWATLTNFDAAISTRLVELVVPQPAPQPQRFYRLITPRTP